MTDQFTSIVKHFLSSDINFALMVNGDWGSGKTHYFKNQFEKDAQKKIVYTSVFGIKNLKEIDHQIVFEKLKLNTKFGKMLTSPHSKLVLSLGKSIGQSVLSSFDFGTGLINKSVKSIRGKTNCT